MDIFVPFPEIGLESRLFLLSMVMQSKLRLEAAVIPPADRISHMMGVGQRYAIFCRTRTHFA